MRDESVRAISTGTNVEAIGDNSAAHRDADNSDILNLYEFICDELAIPAGDVARRVQVAISASVAYYTMNDDSQIIETVVSALSARSSSGSLLENSRS